MVSLVDRHESNGVEGPNKQLLRHLRTLVYDTRIISRWTDPTILCMVLFVIIIIITISYMLIKANTLAVLTSNPPIEASESKS